METTVEWRPICSDHPDPDLWFPEKGEPEKLEEARRICKNCPCSAKCWWIAEHQDERWGVWGGILAEDVQEARKREKRRRLANDVRARLNRDFG